MWCHSAHYLISNAPICSFSVGVGSGFIALFFVVGIVVCNVHTVHNDLTQVLNEASALLFFPVAFSRREGHLDARGRMEAGEEEGARVQFICKARY